MTEHKFLVGEKLLVKPGMLTYLDSGALYEIVGRLPPLHGIFNQYRIRKLSDGQEFVVRESELTVSRAGQ